MNKAENEKQGGWSGPWRHAADVAPFRTTTDLAAVVAGSASAPTSWGNTSGNEGFPSSTNRRQPRRGGTASGPAAGGGNHATRSRSGRDQFPFRRRPGGEAISARAGSEWLDTPKHPNTVPNPKHHLRDVKRYLPSEEEIQKNPRARSARLRVAIRNEEIIP
jgi:hypothetical protein